MLKGSPIWVLSAAGDSLGSCESAAVEGSGYPGGDFGSPGAFFPVDACVFADGFEDGGLAAWSSSM